MRISAGGVRPSPANSSGQLIFHSFTFLPGGHLDPGEGLAHALEREVAEELGLSCTVGEYLGAVEFQWPVEEPTDYEINHLFRAVVDPDAPLASRESHLRFFWCPVDQLDTAALEPWPLREMIRRYAAGDRSLWWATNL